MARIEGRLNIKARSSVDFGPTPFQAAVFVTPGVGKTEHALRLAAEFADKLTGEEGKRLHIFTPDNDMTREPVFALDATGDARLLRLALPYLTRTDTAHADAPHARVT